MWTCGACKAATDRRRYYERARVIVNKQVFFVAGVCQGASLYNILYGRYYLLIALGIYRFRKVFKNVAVYTAIEKYRKF